jgi:hypothetical protein
MRWFAAGAREVRLMGLNGCRKFGRFRAKFAPPVGTLAEV